MELSKDRVLTIILFMIMIALVYVVSTLYIVFATINELRKTDEPQPINHVYVTVVQYDIPEVKGISITQPNESVEEKKPKVSSKKVEAELKPVAKEKPKVVNETPKPVVINKVQPKTNTSGDAYLLAQIIHAEAKGEPYNGKVAVGNVVMNRVDNPAFPDTIKEVVFQKGQFSPVTNGTIYNKPSEEALKAANEVLNGKQIVGEQALYFYNPDTSTSDWIFSRKTIMDIGNHRFAH